MLDAPRDVIHKLVDAGLLASGDRVIFTSGEHMQTRGATNTLRLLRLPESVRNSLIDGRLNEGQARQLVNLSTDLIDEILPQARPETSSGTQKEMNPWWQVDLQRTCDIQEIVIYNSNSEHPQS